MSKAKRKERESSVGVMETNSKDNSRTTRYKEMVSTTGVTAESTLDNGRTTR